MRFLKYKIVTKDTPGELEAAITALLKQDWIPSGSLVVTESNNYRNYSQAMVLPDPNGYGLTTRGEF